MHAEENITDDNFPKNLTFSDIHDHCGKPWSDHHPDGACPILKYEVDVKEVYDRTFLIESDTELTADELRTKANELLEKGEEGINFEYSRTLEPDKWTVKQLLDTGGGIDYM